MYWQCICRLYLNDQNNLLFSIMYNSFVNVQTNEMYTFYTIFIILYICTWNHRQQFYKTTAYHVRIHYAKVLSNIHVFCLHLQYPNFLVICSKVTITRAPKINFDQLVTYIVIRNQTIYGENKFCSYKYVTTYVLQHWTTFFAALYILCCVNL